MAGFGGAMKNMSIGIGSSEGKVLIHTGGKRKIGSIWDGDHWRTALCLRGRDDTAPEGMDA